MRKSLISSGWLVVCLAVCVVSAQEKSAKPKAENKADERLEAEREQILKTAASFKEAYDATDAKAVAAHFLKRAEFIDESGNMFKGREAIEQEFTAFFSENPDAKITMNVDTIRFIGPSIAVEDGHTTVVLEEGANPSTSRYTVVHIKLDDKWMIASARDFEIPSVSIHEKLQPLAWMIGDWVDESEESLIETTCRWSENGCYILRDFSINIEGLSVMNGTQRIGWDPLTKRIKSWVFDSVGGHAEGFWLFDGERWIVQTSGVRPDGKTASATNSFEQLSSDSIYWTSTNRVIDGEPVDDVSVTIVRKPPKPL